MRILGVDPGLANTGWGIIDSIGHKSRPVSFGMIKTTKETPSEVRIFTIAEQLGAIAQKYNVEICSIEDIYFTKNSSSAISVAKVIGSSIHKLSQLNLDVKLYSPLQIKSIITGYGNADKKQVQEMVRLHLGLAQRPKPDHAADALAAALCLATYETSMNRIMK
ncbi:MAG: crossover junction endodeoxyribonuclease RuvC [Sphaerochaetaceae bacterium]|nr:crossover junction endodeoxyribonuclease RuvC [Sphaerochaetaceae bacterium]